MLYLNVCVICIFVSLYKYYVVQGVKTRFLPHDFIFKLIFLEVVFYAPKRILLRLSRKYICFYTPMTVCEDVLASHDLVWCLSDSQYSSTGSSDNVQQFHVFGCRPNSKYNIYIHVIRHLTVAL